MPNVTQTDELLALAFEATVDLAVLLMDSAGRVVRLNAGAELLLGYSDAEMKGINADVIFTPEDLAQGAAEHERAVALETGRCEDERWHMRKDGSRFWGSGVMTALPGGVGLMKFMRDLTERRLADELLKITEERFRTLATNIPQLVFTSLENGSRTWGSPQWVIYTGLSLADSLDFGWLEAVHPDDRAATREQWKKAQQTQSYEMEHRIRWIREGEYRWHQTRAMPLPIGAENAREWVGASTDIHQLRGLKESQQVLMSELQHRTRNLLAIVQSIARRSAKSAESVENFCDELDHRLIALSRAESLIPYVENGTVDIRTLVDAELAAHLPSTPSVQITLDGPVIDLPRATAQSLSLALHELTTNAVKYGALSQASGVLRIDWRRIKNEDEDAVTLEWRETGVAMPAHARPRRKGYGSELIERALPYQLGAETELEFLSDGVRCFVKVPLGSEEQS